MLKVPTSHNRTKTRCIIRYKYWLSHLHIHCRLHRKSPRSIHRGILRIPQPTNHPIVTICTPCTIPEPNEQQDRQIDCIYPLPLAQTIVLDCFDQGPLGTLPKVTYNYSLHALSPTETPSPTSQRHLGPGRLPTGP